MSMISEQVKGLRKLANQWKHNDVAAFNLIFEACDTIEALSAKVRDQNFSADRPTESDFISKAKVLETYSELYWFDIDCGVVSKAEVDKIYERLQSLPSAEPPYQYSEAYVKQLRGERDILEEMVKNMADRPTEKQPITCDGCKHVGTYDTDFPCSRCIRREKDYYEQER